MFLVHRAHTKYYNKSGPIHIILWRIVNVNVTGKSGELCGYQRVAGLGRIGRSAETVAYFHNFEHATVSSVKDKKKKTILFRVGLLSCDEKLHRKQKIPEISEFVDLFDLERFDGEKLLLPRVHEILFPKFLCVKEVNCFSPRLH